MLTKAVEALKEFHDTFGLPSYDKPFVAPGDRKQLRMALIHEEVSELDVAANHGDLVGIADGIADSIYVLLGMALEYGIPIDAILTEVHRSNMSKRWPDGSVRRRTDGKILKPETYSPADIFRILEEARG